MEHYKLLTNSLNNYLFKQLDTLIDNIIYKKNIEIFDYDLIEGLSGIANYLLQYYKRDKSSKAEIYIRKILEYLVKLTKPVDYNGCNLPGWFIKNELLSNNIEKKYYKNGLLNLGLSHGIPGPLIIKDSYEWNGYY
ncbi:MAG: lanthionine synthetase LanC family protein [Clostridiales bacterium]